MKSKGTPHIIMSGTLALQGVIAAVKTAVRGRQPALRAGLASGAAAASRRWPAAALLAPGRAILQRAAALPGAAGICCSSSAEDLVEVELKVGGMVCDGCSSRVAEALQKLPGVKAVNVDLEKGIATVQVEAANQLDAFNAMPQMVDTVVGLGFEAEPFFGTGEE